MVDVFSTQPQFRVAMALAAGKPGMVVRSVSFRRLREHNTSAP
jgi:hypothetical protein